MKLGHFVSSSAIILAGWLGFTFVHEVPVQRYPKLERHATAPPTAATSEVPHSAAARSATGIFHVSTSH